MLKKLGYSALQLLLRASVRALRFDGRWSEPAGSKSEKSSMYQSRYIDFWPATLGTETQPSSCRGPDRVAITTKAQHD
jgi:hypothetical protein